jgi:hypothetical protein
MTSPLAPLRALPPEGRAAAVARIRELLAAVPRVSIPGIEASVPPSRVAPLLRALDAIEGKSK